MKKLTLEAFNDIHTWIYRNARQIELVKWQYEFENRSREAMLSALCFYKRSGVHSNEKYPKEFAVSENWWKADGAIEKLKFLRIFNRIENAG